MLCLCRYHEEKRYSCDKCEKTFRYLPELNSHRLGHEGKFFTCSICPASFRLDNSIYKYKISEIALFFDDVWLVLDQDRGRGHFFKIF
jgi:hypothetical protein